MKSGYMSAFKVRLDLKKKRKTTRVKLVKIDQMAVEWLMC